jgi:hypothetical protein
MVMAKAHENQFNAKPKEISRDAQPRVRGETRCMSYVVEVQFSKPL